ncbi:helix-turn-helix domain-containing protein [Poseidonibacter ostreae]|jgi:transcriptional regulator with XRE-family HTH domain|uniref:Helix-turn-helix domain-containing protein n=1 Tax=Poseidonibacter ostreae TaxID=2654171 RepID=A0A6L4WST4_9BACT|nr:helix-turn-helix domain-containing protein [Poseidonibacter ostreae]KAB7886219.1 helix-turn-helix domain-containing protein [Poseidonibacter ostreae]KAB7886942.1 helix-turn-helix domain-containing protein [Poseidonibacter ostreae]KAB7892235.1 helix-turn-helix domain-containing protein [Poseidonibacter ostreae]MAC83767.1 XRE family transcriptional regulator [Arcobacter sp.]|tara:strand:+ start:1849 stop:2271 length:423 start_codon:yes stop_codon:yes gene_type:complete
MSIKNLRIKKGLSQEQLAELSNLSSRTIQRIEKDNKASCESLTAIAKVFEIEVNELENIMNKKNINSDEVKASKKEDKSFFLYLKSSTKTFKFLIINIFLIVLNLSTNSENLWFPYILIGWGFFHFYKRFIEYTEYKNLK